MSTDLAPTDMTLAEMGQLAKAVAASKLFGMQTPEQALVLMALCRSEGKDPIQAVRQYHIINGKPSMRSDAMLAEFQSRGGTVAWGERSNTSVTGTFSHPSGGELTVTWTLKDAQEAQLTGNQTWKKFPRQMLTARVISEAIRTIFPGVVAGIYAPEEVEDIEPPMRVIEAETATPKRQPAPKAIEAPARVIEAPQGRAQLGTDPVREARAAFYSACDRMEVPIRDAQSKVIPAKVMEVLKALGWPDAAPPATAADWYQSEELLVAADDEGSLDALRGAPKPSPIAVDDLSDPFADDATREEAPNA